MNIREYGEGCNIRLIEKRLTFEREKYSVTMLVIRVNIYYNVDSTFNNSREHGGRNIVM